MSLRTRRLSRRRLFLLIVLIVGQWLLPAFAAACSADDVAADASLRATPGDDGTQRDAVRCCDNIACSDCCLHAGGAPVARLRIALLQVADGEPAPMRVTLTPGDYPVDSRPPIAI